MREQVVSETLPRRFRDISITCPRHGHRTSVAYRGHRLEDERVPVILYLHGGGYVFCTLHSHRDFMSRLVHHTGAALLAVDYRRAPEATSPR